MGSFSTPFLWLFAVVLFLAFAASGIAWLIATLIPTTSESGRRQVGLVAIITGALLGVVLFAGALLAPQRQPPRGPFYRPPPGSGQPFPQQPQQPQQPPASPQPTR